MKSQVGSGRDTRARHDAEIAHGNAYVLKGGKVIDENTQRSGRFSESISRVRLARRVSEERISTSKTRSITKTQALIPKSRCEGAMPWNGRGVARAVDGTDGPGSRFDSGGARSVSWEGSREQPSTSNSEVASQPMVEDRAIFIPVIDSMFLAERELEGVLSSLREGGHLSHGQLLMLQARTYAHMQRVDLLTKTIDRLTQGLRQIAMMQT